MKRAFAEPASQLPVNADMLEAIRQHASSWVVKLLFVLLVLSFVVWGVADVFRPRQGSSWAAKIGSVVVSPGELQEEYQWQLRRLRGALGQSIDSEQARALGLPQAALGRIVDRTLIDLGAQDLGIAVSDTLVRERIQADPRFRNELGQFDRNVLLQALRLNGLTEDRFIEATRGDLARDQLIDSVLAGVVVPQSMADAIYRYRAQQRVVDYIKIEDASITSVGAPTDSELRQYHRDHAVRFTAPEYRALTAVVVSPKDLAAEMTVGDEALAKAHEERAGEFSQPERRALEQMVLKDEAAAKRAYQRLVAGDDFDEVAKEEAGVDADALKLGTITRDQLLPELVDAAFGVAAGNVTEPVQSPLGWHLFKVVAVEPGHQQSFTDVKEKLRADLASEMAIDALFKLTNRLEDALGQGAPLEAAAAELNLKVRHIDAIDAQGLDATATPVADLPSTIIETAFATEEGRDSLLTEAGDDGHFVVRVDKVTPSALRPFETVRDPVLQAWKADKRGELAKQKADQLAERLKGGADIESVAREASIKTATSPAFTRTGGGAGTTLPKELIDAAFRIGAAETQVIQANGATFVVRLKSIIEADPATVPAAVKTVENELATALRNDLLAQLTKAYGQRHPVEINNSVLEQLN